MSTGENQIVVYQPNEKLRLDVPLVNEAMRLNQSRLGELLRVDRTVINRQKYNIYKTVELDESSTCAKIAQVQVTDGGFAKRRRLSCLRLNQKGPRNHSRSSRLNPRSDIRELRRRQAASYELEGIK